MAHTCTASNSEADMGVRMQMREPSEVQSEFGAILGQMTVKGDSKSSQE